jgi:beta-glucosidase-like glycosyl hydrolase
VTLNVAVTVRQQPHSPYFLLPTLQSAAHLALNRLAAGKGATLLQNRNNVLPLSKDNYDSSKPLVIVGPNADNGDVLHGNYAIDPDVPPISIYGGITSKFAAGGQQNCSTLLNDVDFFIQGESGRPADDATDCCALCYANPGCGAFTFYKQQCFLKPAGENQTVSAGRISGVCRDTSATKLYPGCTSYE